MTRFTRRTFLQTCAAATLAAQTRKPINLLIITNDQHRADCLGCYGNPIIRTPSIDRLAKEGTLFENCFVQAPQCVPSRASMLTGRYPHVHRTLTNSYEFPADEVTLPTILQRAGYRTAAVGELPFAPQKHHAGFGEIIASGREYDAFRESKGWRADSSPERKALFTKQFQALPATWPEELDETAFWSAKACDFLDSVTSSPFYLHVNFRRPHHPFDPPAPYDRMYEGAHFPPSHARPGEMENKPAAQQRALKSSVALDLTTMSAADLDRIKTYYYGMISLNDKYIGQILDKLRAVGLESNTVVIFNADHGEMLGDHGLVFKGSYMYDEVVRVPLIIRAPGRLQPGSRISGLVEEVDLVPTVLELLELPPSTAAQGKSLLNHPGKRYAIAEFPTLKMLRSKDWKLVHSTGGQTGELYDLTSDPHELTNLFDHPAFQKKRAELEAALFDRWNETTDPLHAPKQNPNG